MLQCVEDLPCYIFNTPFQVFDSYDVFVDNLVSEEFLGKPLDLEYFSFNEECDDHEIENDDEFLCIRRHKWDMSCSHFDADPINDTEDDFRFKSMELLPLEQPSMYINDSDFGKHEDDMVMDICQPPRNDSLQDLHEEGH
jgi:hypothetical protein